METAHMEALFVSKQNMALYPRWRYLNMMRILVVALFLLTISMDTFAVWAFWQNVAIDAGGYVAISILPITTIVMVWALFSVIYRLPWYSPTLLINAEGLSVFYPLRFISSPFIKQSFIPWIELDCVTTCDTGFHAYLSLKLKDPVRYWSLYGYGRYRKWKPDAVTGGHISIPQMMLESGVAAIVEQMSARYSEEISNYEVKLFA